MIAACVASQYGLAGLAPRTSLGEPRVAGTGGGGSRAPVAAVQERPHESLSPDAVAVRFVVTFPANGCPVEIDLQPRRIT